MKNNFILTTLFFFLCLTTTAQEEFGFKKYDVQAEFSENAFMYFTNAPILMAGDKNEHNAMTIGWGGMGVLWGMHRPVVNVYVAPKRYTYEFMESKQYFCIMEFSDIKVGEYMGSKSGRDGDKGKALGLTLAFTKNGTPYYKEADSIIECEILYSAPFERSGFRNNVPKKMYENFPAGIHTQYIGEVVGAWKK